MLVKRGGGGVSGQGLRAVHSSRDKAEVREYCS